MAVSATPRKSDRQGLRRYVPLMGWLPEYDRSWLRPDIIAGALLVVLTDSMIREAIEHGGKETGLLLVIGFGRSSGSVAAATGVGNG